MAYLRATAFHKDKGMPGYAITGIQPTIPEGRRLLGLGRIEGTPILANSYNGDATCYLTASGEVHDARMRIGRHLGLSFSDGVFVHTDGEQYHGFVCNPPPMLAAAGALKIEVWRRVGDPVNLPAIVFVTLQSAFAGQPAAQDAAFD